MRLGSRLKFCFLLRNIGDKNISNAMYPVRLNIAIMCFMGCFIAYMLRVNLSITILAMIAPRNVDNSTFGNSSLIVPNVRHATKLQTVYGLQFYFIFDYSTDPVMRGHHIRKVYCWEHSSGVTYLHLVRAVL